MALTGLFLWGKNPTVLEKKRAIFVQESEFLVLFFFFFNDLFIYFWQRWVFVAAHRATGPGVCSLVAGHRLLVAAASLVAERGP